MKTISIVYKIDVDDKCCADLFSRRECPESHGTGWCKIFRQDLNHMEDGVPLRCQGCLDAEKEYNKLKDCP